MPAHEPENSAFLNRIREALAPENQTVDPPWRDQLLFEAGKAAGQKAALRETFWRPWAGLAGGLAAGWILALLPILGPSAKTIPTGPQPAEWASNDIDSGQTDPQPYLPSPQGRIWTVRVDPERIAEPPMASQGLFATRSGEPMSLRSIDQMIKELRQ